MFVRAVLILVRGISAYLHATLYGPTSEGCAARNYHAKEASRRGHVSPAGTRLPKKFIGAGTPTSRVLQYPSTAAPCDYRIIGGPETRVLFLYQFAGLELTPRSHNA